MKKIILTGGGTGGHVIPNIALISELKKTNWEIHYIGTKNGIEKSILENEDIIYHEVSAGKLRRYFDIKNFSDPFRVIYGIKQSIGLVKEIKPNIIFSKGGFVSVPVVIGGWFNKVPVIIHESDFTPGLANKLSMPFATKICINFQETKDDLPKNKVVYTGTPIRNELLSGDYEKGLHLCGFKDKKPIVLVMGGSLGSRNINKLVRDTILKLLNNFNIVHICGKGNIDEKLINLSGYKQFEYINKEQPHIFKISDIVISRAGANSIYEFLYLKIPSILIPLSSKSSRGDQILNAKSFEKQGFCKVLEETNLNSEIFLNNILELYNNRKAYINNMSKKSIPNGTLEILKIINEYSR